MPTAVTDLTFDAEVLEAETPVIVDFWADWCGPCKALAPHLERIAAEFAGTVKVVKLDTVANRRSAMKYQVQSLPTLMVFHKGAPVGQITGWRGPEHLASVFDEVSRLT